jgi:hypothetical protein
MSENVVTITLTFDEPGLPSRGAELDPELEAEWLARPSEPWQQAFWAEVDAAPSSAPE